MGGSPLATLKYKREKSPIVRTQILSKSRKTYSKANF